MKAFTANAEWKPKSGYEISADETLQQRAQCGSQVWRNPHFTLQDRPIPSIGDDDLLVKVKRCGICGSDSHLYETDSDGYIIFSGPVKLPCIIGHEYSGIVEKVGKNVLHFHPGDLVAAESIVWCGKCTACRSGAVNQCANVELAGITMDGALADYVRVNALQCWKINSLTARYTEEKTFDIGALIEPLGCAYNGMFINGRGFMPGSTVVIFGAGPIGLGAVMLAHIAGASKIIIFDPIQERLHLAQEMGADLAYNTEELKKAGIKPRDIVLENTDGQGAEMQVEAAGAANATMPEMESSLGVNGTIVYLGRAATHTPILLNNLVSGAKSIVGSRGHSGYGIYPNLIKLLATGKLQADQMITSVFDFPNVLEALKKSVDRVDGKIIVKIS